MKKILLFEDDKEVCQNVVEVLSNSGFQVEVVNELDYSVTSPSFQALVARADEFSAIVWDGYMNRIETIVTTNGFIEAFAKVFKGPMIAFSKSDRIRRIQIAQGCTSLIDNKDARHLRAQLRFELEDK
jgi:CheY-like chemotaxis protein